MLEITLKLDRVHTFGDMSLSQVIEKVDSATEWVSTGQKNAHGVKEHNLVVIISLSFNGLLVETYQGHSNLWNEWYNNYQFPISLD